MRFDVSLIFVSRQHVEQILAKKRTSLRRWDLTSIKNMFNMLSWHEYGIQYCMWNAGLMTNLGIKTNETTSQICRVIIFCFSENNLYQWYIKSHRKTICDLKKPTSSCHTADISTKSMLLRLSSSQPSAKLNSISLAPIFLDQLIWLCYLFFS